MSKNFEKIKKYYDTGLWSIERVKNLSTAELARFIKNFYGENI